MIDCAIAIGLPVLVMILRTFYYNALRDAIVQLTELVFRLCRPRYSYSILLSMESAHCFVGHRFNILEGVGCLPTTVNTPAAYPLVFMWPIVLGCISFVYAGMSPMMLTLEFITYTLHSTNPQGLPKTPRSIQRTPIFRLFLSYRKPILPTYASVLHGDGLYTPTRDLQRLHKHPRRSNGQVGVMGRHPFQFLLRANDTRFGVADK